MGRAQGEYAERAYAQLEHELAVIEQLGFPGYFLIVWDLVEFCRRADIYCQGRGSAANSAVCYALGITNADAVSLGLLFERFLSPERDGPPDIDIDIESDRREEVIQYVYERHGREYAAQVANVITYRAKSSVRDMAKALGFATGQQDAWSKQVDAWGPLEATTRQPDSHDIPAAVLELAAQVENFPRHLGIHSGGMVLCDRPVIEVCPVEWGRMADRSVLQWDKDDCAAVGLVKFDLLGLGMLSALHYAIDLIRLHRGYEVDLATIPQEDAVYDMLCEADSIGVFQVESRAQMATLPRLKPRTFYDLVVEVALIRPGPIQGGSVHPYIRRRNGTEPVTYLHPLLEGSLSKTLGVPLFQEQLMQMAIDVAGFTAAEADQLRQAMGSKRSRRAHGAPARAPVRGHGRTGHHRRDRRSHLREDGGLRELRLPREPLGVVRLPRLRVVVDQAARARGVLRGVAERAADGLLLAAHPRAGRVPPWRRRAHAGPQRERGGGHVGAVRGIAPRRGGAAGTRVGASRRHRPRRRHRRRTPVCRHGGLHSAYRRHAAGARSARDGRCVRLLRGWRRPRARAPVRAVGCGGGGPVARPNGCQAWSSASMRPRCRA